MLDQDKRLMNGEPLKELSAVIKVGKETIRVISAFGGTKTSSELVYNAAVRKILYESNHV